MRVEDLSSAGAGLADDEGLFVLPPMVTDSEIFFAGNGMSVLADITNGRVYRGAFMHESLDVAISAPVDSDTGMLNVQVDDGGNKHQIGSVGVVVEPMGEVENLRAAQVILVRSFTPLTNADDGSARYRLRGVRVGNTPGQYVYVGSEIIVDDGRDLRIRRLVEAYTEAAKKTKALRSQARGGLSPSSPGTPTGRRMF